MIELYSGHWRSNLERLLRNAQHDLLIASPFIKVAEAEWVCNVLASQHTRSACRLQVLSSVQSDSVLGGSLDIDALRVFAELGSNATVTNLPRLHAKVYIADTDMAIVTSANLTPSGLDRNYEYGVGLQGELLVGRIRSDLEAYLRVGNALPVAAILELATLGAELAAQYRNLQRSPQARLKRRFEQSLERVNFEFLKAQVGTRSAHGLFVDAILYLLSKGPLTTRALAPEIQKLLPDLCDDSIELVINGERFGKRWKHDVRNAQQSLKRRRAISFDGKSWALAT